LFGYYNVLLGNGALLYSIKNETSVKPRIAALAAITALLSDAKHFLAQAQHRYFISVVKCINLFDVDGGER
jgi:hypothetical protein